MFQHLIEHVRKEVDQFGSDGDCRVRLAFVVRIYFQHFRSDAEGVRHFFNTVLPLIRDRVHFFDVDGKNRPKKITPAAFSLLDKWVALEDANTRDIWGLELESGRTRYDRSDLAFRFFSMYIGSGVLMLYMPVESMLDPGPEALIALIARATAELRLLHGTAGFGVNIDPGYPSQYEEFAVYGLSRRYRGIELDEPDWFSSYAAQGIPYVNWLTLLGEDCLSRLGGREALAPLADADVRLHPLSHGMLIQAGAMPSFGDVNRGETLEAYRKVGRFLAPLRVKSGRIERYNGVGGQENTQDWLARFDN